MAQKYTRGQRVTCNGNPDGIVQDYYGDGMVNVRLFDGLRHVGDVCVGESSLDRENKVATAPATKVMYDYRNQAWIKNGRYADCGHPADMHCGCYGRQHKGEVAEITEDCH